MSLFGAIKGLFTHVATSAQTGVTGDVAALEQHIDAFKADLEAEIKTAVSDATAPLKASIAALEARMPAVAAPEPVATVKPVT